MLKIKDRVIPESLKDDGSPVVKKQHEGTWKVVDGASQSVKNHKNQSGQIKFQLPILIKSSAIAEMPQSLYSFSTEEPPILPWENLSTC